MNVAVIGASHKPERYSYQAVLLLHEKGYTVFPVHPRIKEIHGLRVFSSIRDIPEPIHTVTMYVGAEISDKMGEDLCIKKPERVIFNPGSENSGLEEQLKSNGIITLRACTLVLLKTGQF